MDPSRYGIDPDRGFLPNPDPMRTEDLPDTYAPWKQLARDLPKLLATGQIRGKLYRMPALSVPAVADQRVLRALYRMVAFLAHADVYPAGSIRQAKPSIAQSVAIPLCEISTRLGVPPAITYDPYALSNWYRIRPDGPIELGNIALIQNFLGGQDEEWFILPHIEIEAKYGRALRQFPVAQFGVLVGDEPTVAEALWQIADVTQSLYETLKRTLDGCDPYIYYHRVRPFIHGWKNNPGLPDGVIYEGVDEFGGKPQQFYGETGAQSSVVPTLYALLGIEFAKDWFWDYLLEMRRYMPPAHRAFIEAVEQGPPLRQFVQMASDPHLRDAYNATIEALARFLQQHYEFADIYIYRQQQKSAANPTRVGTGGTPFLQYLQEHIKAVRAHRI
ncbi:MAG: hypothetical protein Q8Q39_02945 [bacterium]|nr:hypothetical protein [bacterium]